MPDLAHPTWPDGSPVLIGQRVRGSMNSVDCSPPFVIESLRSCDGMVYASGHGPSTTYDYPADCLEFLTGADANEDLADAAWHVLLCFAEQKREPPFDKLLRALDAWKEARCQ